MEASSGRLEGGMLPEKDRQKQPDRVDHERPSIVDPAAASLAVLPAGTGPTRDTRGAGDGAAGTAEGKAPEADDLDRARVDRARAAAAGWGGDRYRAFETPDGATIVVWQTAWDTEPDAIEFESAMRDVAAQQAPRPGTGAMTVVRRGSAVTCIAGASKARSAAAMAALEALAARGPAAAGAHLSPGSAVPPSPSIAPIDPPPAGVRPRP